MGEMINPGSNARRGLEAAWPSLPLAAWRDTRDTLHLWTQMAGKIRLALSPTQNHWWHVPLYVSGRGLSTSSIPYLDRIVELRFDFLSHELVIECSDGGRRSMALEPRTVKSFYEELMGHMRALGIDVTIRTMPVEIANAIPFEKDEVHRSYDADYAYRFWQSLVRVERVFEQFRSSFVGKASPVHFFWGSFDLTTTRFSGRRAPPHGEVPNISLPVIREAYSHEQASIGFWTGGGGYDDAAFFAYCYPEPTGYAQGQVPAPTFFSEALREFVLPYEAVRTARDPEGLLLAFAQSTYDLAADLAQWNRAALERAPSAMQGLQNSPNARPAART